MNCSPVRGKLNHVQMESHLSVPQLDISTYAPVFMRFVEDEVRSTFT